jgi:phage terminase large subunit-like protein
MMIRIAEKYIDDALTGKVLVSRTTRLTFERHRNDLKVAPENGWYFDKKSVERVFDFCTFLRHCPDKRHWVPFTPEPWEAAIIYIVFGWKKKDGTRRFTYGYIEIPKKNGKTTFASVFGNYLLFFDGEQEAEVYCAASVEKQARICFNQAKKMIEHSPDLRRRTKILTKNINIPSTSSKMEMLGRDSDTMEGINPSGGVIDELHVWKNLEVLENMESASVARVQPLFVMITTAGKDKTLPCFARRSLYIEIMKGIKRQDDTFAIIYTLDPEDDWKDPACWKKANPNWGVSVNPDRFKSEFEGAMNDPRKEVTFKTKNLNLWVDAPEVWITDEKWQLCSHGTNEEDLLKQQCYWGLDLASHVDINALAAFFPDINGRPAAKIWYWIPEAKVKEQEDRVDYRTWVKQGRVKTTAGDVIDIEQQVTDIMHLTRQYQVEGLGFDPAKAYHGTIQGLKAQGFDETKMDEYPQGIMNMSPPSKEFQKMVMSGNFEHLNDPVLRWMMGNVVIYSDINENIKPDKKRSRNKIDGIVALIIAIGTYLTAMYGGDDKEIYKDHSLRTVNF